MSVRRRPAAHLAPFVEALWFSETERDGVDHATLPTGSMSLAVRLTDEPITVVEPDGTRIELGAGALGGTRTTWYDKPGATRGTRSIGVQFRPGGAAALLGVDAAGVAEGHTSLEALWGERAALLRERLADAPTPECALDRMECELAERVGNGAAAHPAVAWAVERIDTLGARTSIDALRREAGLSHRRFVEVFRRGVGVGPKAYARLVRFRDATRRIAAARGRSDASVEWADLAVAAGYSDQSHLCREFRRIAGRTPAAYRPLAPDRPGHAV